MIAPLGILAILSIATGFSAVASRMSPLYGNFPISSTALTASVASLLIGAVLAWKLYFSAESDPLENNGIAKVFRNKFYLDELYAKIVGYGQDLIAAIVHFIDELVIGGLLVGGLSRAAAGAGKIFTRMQSGNLQGYAGLFALGVILVIYLTVFFS